MKTVYRILITAAVCAAFISFMLFDAYHAGVRRWSVRREDLSSEKIPEQLEGISILYFSDLKYGTFMDSERLASLASKIRLLSYDVAVFGGDVFDDAAAVPQDLTPLHEFFASIEAPLGKFAVMGDTDRASESHTAAVTEIMKQADFEVLNNTSAVLHNHGSQSVSLIGLDNGLNGLPDTAPAYENISPNSYVIAVCHTPDSASSLRGDLTDYFLTGHSLGGQAYRLFSYQYTPAMAVRYFRGKYELGEFTIDITDGTGTTGTDVRFFTKGEVVLYTLHHKESSSQQNVPADHENHDTSPSADDVPSPDAEQPAEETPAEQGNSESTENSGSSE